MYHIKHQLLKNRSQEIKPSIPQDFHFALHPVSFLLIIVFHHASYFLPFHENVLSGQSHIPPLVLIAGTID